MPKKKSNTKSTRFSWSSLKTASGMKLKHSMTKKMIEELYRFVAMTRFYEDKLPNLYRQGKLFGGVYRATGHEGISVGCAYALDKSKGDIIAPIHRGSGAHLVFGQPLERLYCNYMGRECGPTRGRDGNVHHGELDKQIIGMISHLGSSIPIAVGAAIGKRMQGENAVTMTFIGDGGSSIGDFHEGLNFAAVQNAPFVLVIENNQYAYSTPNTLQFKCAELVDRAKGYGIRGIKGLGADVIEAYQLAKEAVEHARSGKGPVLLELETMRFHGHSEHDNHEYVPDAVYEEWKDKDPFDLARKFLVDNNILSAKQVENIDKELREAVNKAADFAWNQPFPEGESILEGVYHEEVQE
jgi:TPP-dependent pyruvate/acetoin dehydrogenase alpha subunit